MGMPKEVGIGSAPQTTTTTAKVTGDAHCWGGILSSITHVYSAADTCSAHPAKAARVGHPNGPHRMDGRCLDHWAMPPRFNLLWGTYLPTYGIPWWSLLRAESSLPIYLWKQTPIQWVLTDCLGLTGCHRLFIHPPVSIVPGQSLSLSLSKGNRVCHSLFAHGCST